MGQKTGENCWVLPLVGVANPGDQIWILQGSLFAGRSGGCLKGGCYVQEVPCLATLPRGEELFRYSTINFEVTANKKRA